MCDVKWMRQTQSKTEKTHLHLESISFCLNQDLHCFEQFNTLSQLTDTEMETKRTIANHMSSIECSQTNHLAYLYVVVKVSSDKPGFGPESSRGLCLCGWHTWPHGQLEQERIYSTRKQVNPEKGYLSSFPLPLLPLSFSHFTSSSITSSLQS